jgi:hypothetical protein
MGLTIMAPSTVVALEHIDDTTTTITKYNGAYNNTTSFIHDAR